MVAERNPKRQSVRLFGMIHTLHKRYFQQAPRKGRGFIVLGISDETIAKQQAFVSQVPVTYPLLTITPGVPAFYREIAKYPAIFLIDREGRLHPSPNESQGFGNVEEAVDSLLNGGK
jgi:peroxiredoxin